MVVAAALLLTAATAAHAQLTANDALGAHRTVVDPQVVEDCPRDVGSTQTSTDGNAGSDDSSEYRENDNRENLITSAYLGTAVDNFAGSEVLKYLNPEDAGSTGSRLIFGFDFEFRLTGDRGKSTTPRNSQLWLYGETLHGVRSRDVECPTEGEGPAVCADLRNKKLFPELNDIPQRAAFILKNATSLEAYMGLRWEFLGINQAEDNQPTDAAAASVSKGSGGVAGDCPRQGSGGSSDARSWQRFCRQPSSRGWCYCHEWKNER